MFCAATLPHTEFYGTAGVFSSLFKTYSVSSQFPPPFIPTIMIELIDDACWLVVLEKCKSDLI